MEYDEYEALEAEAEALAKKPSEQGQKVMFDKPKGKGVKPVEIPQVPTQPQVQAPQQAQAQTEMVERPQGPWVPVHQPEVLGLMNQDTGKVMVIKTKTSEEDGLLEVYAELLNQGSLIITSGGYQ